MQVGSAQAVVGVSHVAVLHYQFVRSFSGMPPSIC